MTNEISPADVLRMQALGVRIENNTTQPSEKGSGDRFPVAPDRDRRRSVATSPERAMKSPSASRHGYEYIDSGVPYTILVGDHRYEDAEPLGYVGLVACLICGVLLAFGAVVGWVVLR